MGPLKFQVIVSLRRFYLITLFNYGGATATFGGEIVTVEGISTVNFNPNAFIVIGDFIKINEIKISCIFTILRVILLKLSTFNNIYIVNRIRINLVIYIIYIMYT